MTIAEPLIVIDIETDVCDATYQRMAGTLRDPIRHGSLNRIRALAAMTCEPSDRGWRYNLSSCDGDEEHNLNLLANILAENPAFALLTFNGSKHDLPIVELRAIHAGSFQSLSLGRLHARRHYDLMQMVKTQCSLDTLGAAFRLPRLDRRSYPGPAISWPRRKCEFDVVKTLLAYFHLIAFRACKPALLTEQWIGLRDHFADTQIGKTHLAGLLPRA